jgi:hypothetical protein
MLSIGNAHGKSRKINTLLPDLSYFSTRRTLRIMEDCG